MGPHPQVTNSGIFFAEAENQLMSWKSLGLHKNLWKKEGTIFFQFCELKKNEQCPCEILRCVQYLA